MRFLPIVERELRVSARRRGTYWLRSLVALVVIVISGCIFIFNFDDSPRQVAQVLFYTLTSGALLYSLLAGLRSTADCISEEKREGTLGLLFLTDLKGYDVVLGKLVASSLNGFYGLLAILPVMGIPLLMGGLTGIQIARVALVLVNTMFFSMSVGVFASATSLSMRRSIGLTFLLIMIFTAGFPALGATLSWKYGWREMEDWGLLSCPVFSYVAASSKAVAMRSANAFYWSTGLIHGLGWFFLALACFIAPRAWQDRPAGALRLRWRERLKQWSFGDSEQRRAFRARLLNQNAFFWLAARARLKPAWVWFFLGVVACIWTWGIAKFYREWLTQFVYILTAVLVNSILKNWLASEAVRQLSEDRRMGSLELLLSTPMTVKEILRGQALALRRQFLGPVIVTVLAELVMLVAGASDDLMGSDRTAWICFCLAGIIMLVVDLVALYWVGMWLGLAAKNPKRAFGDTIGRILALPWVAMGLFMTLVAVFSMHGGYDPGWKLFLGMWMLLGIGTDVAFALWARHKLLSEFRIVATQRFQARPSLWKRWFGAGSGHAVAPD